MLHFWFQLAYELLASVLWSLVLASSPTTRAPLLTEPVILPIALLHCLSYIHQGLPVVADLQQSIARATPPWLSCVHETFRLWESRQVLVDPSPAPMH